MAHLANGKLALLGDADNVPPKLIPAVIGPADGKRHRDARDKVGQRWRNRRPSEERHTATLTFRFRREPGYRYWLCWPPGSDIPDSACPTAGESCVLAMSPSETMPTSRLLRSTTGNRRTWISPMF